jgi:hypothetical protein
MEEATHKEFLLAALRAASARARAMMLDIDSIGVALKGDLIVCETAVDWIRQANLLGMVGALPEEIGRGVQDVSTITISAAEVMADAT